MQLRRDNTRVDTDDSLRDFANREVSGVMTRNYSPPLTNGRSIRGYLLFVGIIAIISLLAAFIGRQDAGAAEPRVDFDIVMAADAEPEAKFEAEQDENIEHPREDWPSALIRLSEQAQSDFVRDILSDGAITPEEVEIAHSKFTTCLDENEIGWNSFFNSDGFRITYADASLAWGGDSRPISPQLAQVQLALNCMEQYFGVGTPVHIPARGAQPAFYWWNGSSIAELAWSNYANPDALTDNERLLVCLHNNNLVPADLTIEALEYQIVPLQQTYRELRQEQRYGPQAMHELTVARANLMFAVLPGGLEWQSPEVTACNTDWRADFTQIAPENVRHPNFRPFVG